MIALFVATGLIPVAVSLGIVVWLQVGRADPAAGWIARRVAFGLAAGAIAGAALGLSLVLVVALVGRAGGR